MTTLPTHEQTPSIVTAARTPVSAMPRPGRPVAGNKGMTGRDVMRVFRKHILLIIIMLTVFTLASVGGTFVWLKYAPTYTSRAQLRVAPPRRAYDPNPVTNAANLDIRKQTYVSRAKNESVLRRAITQDLSDAGARQDRIQKTSFYLKDLKNTITLLQDELSVSPIRDTELIQISLSGSNPAELPGIVDAVADALVRNSKEETVSRRDTQMKTLINQQKEARGKIDALKKKIDQNRGDSDVPLMIERRNITHITLQTLTSDLTQLRLLKAQAEAALEALQEQHKDGNLAESLEVLEALEQDPTYRSLAVSVENTQIEYDSLLRRVMPGHRSAKALKARLETITKKRDELKVKLVEQLIQGMMQRQQSQVTAVSERLLAIGNQYTEEAAKLRDLGSSLTKIAGFQAEIDRNQGLITQVTNALVQFRIAQDEAPISVVSHAAEPNLPSMPKFSIMVPLGVFLGLAIGLGLAFLMELMDTSIKSPADIAGRIDLPLLGMVPHADDMDEEIEDMRTVMLTNADSLAGEAYRQIRTCLLFSGPASQRRSLMITSPSPGDGRTAVTMNLAASIAHGGRKVLVVDANFRQPSLSELFPQASANGLSSALVGQGRWEDNVHQVDGNLSVMTAGPLPPNPAELLGSEQMRTIIGEMTAKYDQVIFDAAPALVVTDPSVLSTLVDGVIIVIRAGTSTHGILQRTRDIFLRVGAHVLGAVLNRVRVTAGGYLKRNYDTFYEYRGHNLPAPAGRPAASKAPLPPTPKPTGDIEMTSSPESGDDADLG